jgi:hypothetical protein
MRVHQHARAAAAVRPRVDAMNQSDRTLSTINDRDPFAMRYWSKQLRISERDLREAIAAVGTSTQAVRQYTRPQANHADTPRGASRRRGG